MMPFPKALRLGRFYRCLIRYTDDLGSGGQMGSAQGRDLAQVVPWPRLNSPRPASASLGHGVFGSLSQARLTTECSRGARRRLVSASG
jgi:hypothetical protein